LQVQKVIVLHTSKKSFIGWALARFFCGLLIGSNIGVNAKRISTIENMSADKILRLKSSNPASSPSPTYNYSKLQHEHRELKPALSSTWVPSWENVQT
jgi:hypothetical protein